MGRLKYKTKIFLIFVGIIMISLTGYSAWKVNKEIEEISIDLVQQNKQREILDITGWEEYVDNDTGIRFKYPNNFIINKINSTLLFELPQNLQEVEFIISFKKEKINTQEEIINGAYPFEESLIVIDGVKAFKKSYGNLKEILEIAKGIKVQNNKHYAEYGESIEIPGINWEGNFNFWVRTEHLNMKTSQFIRDLYNIYLKMIYSIDLSRLREVN